MASNTAKRAGKKFTAIWRRNSVLSMGLGLMPAVILTSSLKHAIAICIVVGIVIFPTYLLASLLKLKKPFYIRIAMNALIAAAFTIPGMLIVSKLFPDFTNVYVYISSVIMDTLIIYRADEYARRNKPSLALMDAFVNYIGFALVMFILAPLRELFGTGAIMGRTIYDTKYTVSGVISPFFGFIAVGMLAALLNLLTQTKKAEILPDGTGDKDEQKRSFSEFRRRLGWSKPKAIAQTVKTDTEVSNNVSGDESSALVSHEDSSAKSAKTDSPSKGDSNEQSHSQSEGDSNEQSHSQSEGDSNEQNNSQSEGDSNEQSHSQSEEDSNEQNNSSSEEDIQSNVTKEDKQ